MPGYVNYFYNDDTLPAHKNAVFISIHSSIVKKALLFIHKRNYFHSLVPESVPESVITNMPKFVSNYEKYIRTKHISFVFTEGPLLYISATNIENITPNTAFS